MEDILKMEQSFEKVGATCNPVTYSITEDRREKGGSWYMTETFIRFENGTPYHTFKMWRSKRQALEAYNNAVSLEEWRQAGDSKIDK